MATSDSKWAMNINTWIMIAGFAITVGGGYGTYTSFTARIETQVAELKAQRGIDVARMEAKAAALDAAVQNLSIQDARQIEQINAMLSYLQRIERTLDTLVKESRNDQQ